MTMSRGISLRFDPAPYLSSTTKFEYSHLDQNGYFAKLIYLPPTSNAPLEAGLETGCGSFANIPALAACGATALAPTLNNHNLFTNNAGGSLQANVKTWHFAEDVGWDITDDVHLRSITGFHRVLDFQNLELDASPFQILEVGAGADGGVQPIAPFPAYPNARTPETLYHSWTQEFNLSGHAFRQARLVGGRLWELGKGPRRRTLHRLWRPDPGRSQQHHLFHRRADPHLGGLYPERLPLH
jgi:hypothetical protein